MKISNQHLEATFKTKGAELISLKKVDTGHEYIWYGDPTHWGRHAPVLFPFVGKLKENAYVLEEKKFEMGQHGFARDHRFNIICQQEDFIRFSFSTIPATLEVYPFQFELFITYELVESSLKVTYEVQNLGAQDLYFSIGGHPAFNCPMLDEEVRSDYWLEFNQEEKAVSHLLTDGLFTGKTIEVLTGKRLGITNSLFDQDALVFKELKSDQVSLVSPSRKWFTFHFEGFPYLGIWSKSRESPFVCIEPWFGLADQVDHDQDISGKEGIILLKKNKAFKCAYQIDIHE